MDVTHLKHLGEIEAQKAFDECLVSLQRITGRLKIPMPAYAKVSGIFVRLCANRY